MGQPRRLAGKSLAAWGVTLLGAVAVVVAQSDSPTVTPSVLASPTGSATSTRSPSLSPSSVSVCNVRAVMGTGTAGSTGDGGLATSATLNAPYGVAVNGSVLYVGEITGSRVRRVDLATGIATTYAGTGGSTGSYVGVAATSAGIGNVANVLLLPNGDLLISSGRCVLLAVDAGTEVTVLIAGTGSCLTNSQAAGDGVLANSTALGAPRGTALWGTDGVFVCTRTDDRVRLVNLTTGACMSLREGRGGGDCVVVLLDRRPPTPTPWAVSQPCPVPRTCTITRGCPHRPPPPLILAETQVSSPHGQTPTV